MAALTCAAAAALVTMCARFAHDGLGGPIVAETADWPDELASLAERDGANFGAFMATWRLPSDDPNRDTAYAQGISLACEVPLRICELGQRLAEHALTLAEQGNPNLEGDALTGLHLASAAVESATQLIRLNTQQRPAAPPRAEAEALREQVRATMRRLSPERR
jgi:formiminotetrahydrofolate cyclodeaminase